MRNWTQRHIEDLIKRTAKQLGLTGGEPTREQLLRALVGTRVNFPVASRHSLCTLTARCLEFRKATSGPFMQLEWQFQLRIQKNGVLDAAVGDTCFATMVNNISLFEENGIALINRATAFPNTITMGIEGSDGATVQLRKASEFQIRMGGGTTRPLLTVTDSSLLDYRYATQPPSGNMTGLWNQTFTY